MNTETGLEIPPGTSVYCCPRGLVLDLSWQSRMGTHIVRLELPLAMCQEGQRAALRAAACAFRRAAALEGFRAAGGSEPE